MMNISLRNISELIPYERNQKKHDEKQVRNIANSLKRFGWVQPIVVDKKDVVIIGHGRLLAAKMLSESDDSEWCVAPVVVADELTEDEVRELRIADNKLNESPWDFAQLDLDIGELTFEGFDFGFGDKEFDLNSMNDLFNDADTKEKEPKKIQCPHCGEWIEV